MSGLAKTSNQPGWLVALREAITDGVSADDVKAIVGAQVAKAKAGDEKAAKWVLDILAKQPAPQPPVTNATQNVFHIHLSGTKEPDMEEQLRLKLVALSQHAGELTAGQAAAQLGVDPALVESAVRHPWFKAGRDGRFSVVRGVLSV